ncbi:hypothetical protein FEF22_000515 [Texas Phoenix palm phytoplasma]|uniref:Uncharacterized protein n=1 Tax=Texas Phoenix palm phytoplasma TaxID=176709 RepID=A0ABS5BI63_9MOLU|nr:hypothetical protein [Texas Phoenix palm phytoplasma]MBP3059271.1 hypothetical protein [Texas Phoenix palm phytoplasma]
MFLYKKKNKKKYFFIFFYTFFVFLFPNNLLYASEGEEIEKENVCNFISAKIQKPNVIQISKKNNPDGILLEKKYVLNVKSIPDKYSLFSKKKSEEFQKYYFQVSVIDNKKKSLIKTDNVFLHVNAKIFLDSKENDQLVIKEKTEQFDIEFFVKNNNGIFESKFKQTNDEKKNFMQKIPYDVESQEIMIKVGHKFNVFGMESEIEKIPFSLSVDFDLVYNDNSICGKDYEKIKCVHLIDKINPLFSREEKLVQKLVDKKKFYLIKHILFPLQSQENIKKILKQFSNFKFYSKFEENILNHYKDNNSSDFIIFYINKQNDIKIFDINSLDNISNKFDFFKNFFDFVLKEKNIERIFILWNKKNYSPFDEKTFSNLHCKIFLPNVGCFYLCYPTSTILGSNKSYYNDFITRMHRKFNKEPNLNSFFISLKEPINLLEKIKQFEIQYEKCKLVSTTEDLLELDKDFYKLKFYFVEENNLGIKNNNLNFNNNEIE